MAERLATADDLPSEFDSANADDVAFWLDVAARRVSVDVFGEDASYAHAMLTAHMLKQAGIGSSSSTGAPVTSRRVGDVAETYASTSASLSGSDLDRTKYGQAFRALMRLHPVVGVVA